MTIHWQPTEWHLNFSDTAGGGDGECVRRILEGECAVGLLGGRSGDLLRRASWRGGRIGRSAVHHRRRHPHQRSCGVVVIVIRTYAAVTPWG